MEQLMTPIGAIKTFFNTNTSRPVTVPEIMEFWKSCTPQEKREFAESAAKQLGVGLKELPNA